MTSPCSTSSKRKPVTANSRQTMIATTQPGAFPWSTNMIKAVITSILSANGSANLPKLVTRPRARAIFPSNQSVILAKAKITAPTSCVTASVVSPTLNCPQSKGKPTTKMKIGIIQILSTVNLFGKFTLSTPFFPILRDYQRSFHRYYLLFQMNLFKGVFLLKLIFLN
ncbi:UNVERIFIED_ORG: hypothetical protein QQG_4997 [Clostridioides difficile Y384]